LEALDAAVLAVVEDVAALLEYKRELAALLAEALALF
jgi:hypothetical protein